MARTVRKSGMKEVPLSEVKDDLSRYLKEAEKEQIVITRHGKPAGVLIGFESEDEWFDFRLENDPRFLKPDHITTEKLGKIRQLDALARARGQSLAQMSLAWVLRNPAITSALIGASKVSQIEENVAALANLPFSPDELAKFDRILGG